MKYNELARAVAERLKNETAWQKYSVARDSYGHAVHPKDPAAVRWCALGHAEAVGTPDTTDELNRTYNAYYGALISSDNDIHGREVVMNRLIRLAEYLENLTGTDPAR